MFARDCVCCRYTIEADMAQRVIAEKEAGTVMVDSLHGEIQHLKEKLRLSTFASPEGQVPFAETGIGAEGRALKDLAEELKKQVALSAVQASLLEEKSGEILICRQEISNLQKQNTSVNEEEIKSEAVIAATAYFEAERVQMQSEMDRRISESLEKQKAEYAQKMDALMQEHKAAMDGERRTASEKAESSMTREKSFSSLQSTFDEKLHSSDAQLANLKQQLNR